MKIKYLWNNSVKKHSSFYKMSLTATFQEDSYSMRGEPGLCKAKWPKTAAVLEKLITDNRKIEFINKSKSLFFKKKKQIQPIK